MHVHPCNKMYRTVPLHAVISHNNMYYSSVVDCGALTSLSYGEVSVNETTFRASAVYTCNSGFLLQGNRSRTCQADGNWSSSEPQCKGKELPMVLE